MAKIDIQDQTIDVLAETSFDFFIASSGYEKRARYLGKRLAAQDNIQASTKYCIHFDDYKDADDRAKNDAFFEREGFTPLAVDNLPFGGLSRQFDTLSFRDFDSGTPIRILVDYSAMRRSFYAELVQYLSYLADLGNDVEVVFSYTVGRYMGKKEPKIVEDYLLVPGFDGMGRQKNEKFGIFNLGFEPVSVQSLYDWVEPRGVACIVANPGANKGSRDFCLRLNKSFIEQTQGELYETSLVSVAQYCQLVHDLIKKYSNDFDVVILGSGPKPFTLGGFLCNLVAPSVSNIYLHGRESSATNVEATGEIICTKVRFSR